MTRGGSARRTANSNETAKREAAVQAERRNASFAEDEKTRADPTAQDSPDSTASASPKPTPPGTGASTGSRMISRLRVRDHLQRAPGDAVGMTAADARRPHRVRVLALPAWWAAASSPAECGPWDAWMWVVTLISEH